MASLLSFSKLVLMVAEHANESTTVLISSLKELMIESGVNEQLAAKVSAAVVAAGTTDEGLELMQDLGYKACHAGEMPNNPAHSAYYYRLAEHTIARKLGYI